MIKLSIPGQETALNLTTLLLDVNGTITVDGELIEGTTELIDLLKKGSADLFINCRHTWQDRKIS